MLGKQHYLVRVWFCCILCRACSAGSCFAPPTGILTFCQIDYQVYVLDTTLNAETFVNLDKGAQAFAERLYSAYRPYACAAFFLKCDSNGERPLPVCKANCYQCLDTCRYERTIVPPGLYITNPNDFANLGKISSTADAMQSASFDIMVPSYRCEVDPSLAGPAQVPWLFQHVQWSWLYDPHCTSSTPSRPRPASAWAVFVAAAAVTAALALVVGPGPL